MPTPIPTTSGAPPARVPSAFVNCVTPGTVSPMIPCARLSAPPRICEKARVTVRDWVAVRVAAVPTSLMPIAAEPAAFPVTPKDSFSFLCSSVVSLATFAYRSNSARAIAPPWRIFDTSSSNPTVAMSATLGHLADYIINQRLDIHASQLHGMESAAFGSQRQLPLRCEEPAQQTRALAGNPELPRT